MHVFGDKNEECRPNIEISIQIENIIVLRDDYFKDRSSIMKY